jgi:hypothetical protein
MQREGQYNWREYDSFSGQKSEGYDSTRQEGRFNPRTSFGEETQSGFPQQEGQTPGSPGEFNLPREQSFNSIFNQNRTQSPPARDTGTTMDPSFGSGWQPRAGGYTPYKSPYQTQREQRQEQGGRYTPYKSPYQTQREQQQEQGVGYREPKQEYQREDTFQQWKKRNPSQFDPTSDDAFIEEMMPKNRR